jgi:hypothetical protein
VTINVGIPTAARALVVSEVEVIPRAKKKKKNERKGIRRNRQYCDEIY